MRLCRLGTAEQRRVKRQQQVMRLHATVEFEFLQVQACPGGVGQKVRSVCQGSVRRQEEVRRYGEQTDKGLQSPSRSKAARTDNSEG